MPRALLDRLKEAADARSHSMNAEIVQRLEATLFEPEEAADGTLRFTAPDEVMEKFQKAVFAFEGFEKLASQMEESAAKIQKYIEENEIKSKYNIE
ncbi:hypothetical protein AD949_10525 [Acetobacter orleanensis]|nr:hypothetical protein AD949_10525 [Acetobacter orleanensis]